MMLFQVSRLGLGRGANSTVVTQCLARLQFSTQSQQDGSRQKRRGRQPNKPNRRQQQKEPAEEVVVHSDNFPPELLHLDITEEDFPVRTLKPGAIKRSDIKNELIRGMSVEDKKLVIDVKIPPNPSNPLLKEGAPILSEAIMARRVNKVTSGGKREKLSVLIAVGDGN